jgi:hypothetical protein
MVRIDGENLYTMRARISPAVITMPARRPGGVVVAMPPRTSKVLTMPAHRENKPSGPAPNSALQPTPISKLAANCDALYCGMRMTLLALLALLGWPRPTRDNDPGPSAARPGFWEMVNLVSKVRLLRSAQPSAARAAMVELQSSCFEEAA